jgi:hypothetical protein
MSTAISISPAVKPTVQLSLVGSQPVKFDAAFLDRRMREHRMWQQRVTEETTREVICEIADAMEVYTGRGPQRIVRTR